MEVKTKAYGTMDVSEKQKISLEAGFFGFEQFHEYVLLDAQQKPFLILQSLDDPQVAFILIDPAFFRGDYNPSVGNTELEKIGLINPLDSQALVLAVVTIPPKGDGAITANLQGPLVINRESRQGMQCIAQDSRWMTKHDILQEMAQQRTSSC
ncbi:MAG: flagellar assembly protein FliW [Spirochaetaceae bacterium]|jgi:flagellar assembly factor FliW|nr:flagellar assembly protein FliW [Spirochaetaceae bacterium]